MFVFFNIGDRSSIEKWVGWIGLDFVQENKSSVACLQGSWLNPFMYDVLVVVQVISWDYWIFFYGKEHGAIYKRIDISFFIFLKVIDVYEKY